MLGGREPEAASPDNTAPHEAEPNETASDDAAPDDAERSDTELKDTELKDTELKDTGPKGASSPESPTDLSKPSLKAVVKRSGTEFKSDHLTVLAAALTYYGVLSVLPGLIVLFAILGLLGKSTTHDLVTHVQSVAPGSSAHFIRSLINQAQSDKKDAGVGAIIGIVIAFWSASGYVNAFRQASNIIYGIEEGRPIWKTLPLRLAVTLVAVVILILSAVIVVVSGPVAKQVGDAVGAGNVAVTVWGIVKWPVLFVLVSVLLAVLFWASPNAKQGSFKWISPGGLIATAAWLIVSALFAVYVVNFSSYNKTYGSLAGIVIFLIWLWLTNIALLFGAEVNAELDHGRAIAEGLPEDVRPFAVPRDTRKMSEADKQAVEEAQAARTN
jgi:membrane protein